MKKNKIINKSKISLSFHPSINGISFGSNCEMVMDETFSRHIKGDIFYEKQCIGYYDPLYQKDRKFVPQEFIRIENQDFVNKYANYRSIFAYNYILGTENSVGFEELLKDLEFMTYIYTFMHSVKKDDKFEDIGLVGIVNNEFIKVIQIKDKNIQTKEEIIKFYKEKISDYGNLDNNYPIQIFRNISDFSIETTFL